MQQKYNLTPRERDILNQAQFNSELTAQQIARAAKTTPTAVAYSLRTLHERAIIARRALIDFYKLGYTNYAIFFCLESETSAQHAKLLRHLGAHPQVAWLGSLTGEYHYGLAFLARNISELQQLLLDASDKYEVSFAHKSIIPRVSITFYPRRYLSEQKTPVSGITIRSDGKLFELEQTDHQILHALANTPYTSLRDIAQRTGLNPSKVERHVRKLQEQGVIAARYLSINVDLLGINSFRLLLQLNRVSGRTKKSLTRFCESTSSVIMFTECIGEWDYEIDVEVSNPNEIATLTQKLYEVCDGDLRRVQTLSELEDLKYSFFPFDKH